MNSSRSLQSRRSTRSQSYAIAQMLMLFLTQSRAAYPQLLYPAQTPHILCISGGASFLANNLLAADFRSVDITVSDRTFLELVHPYVYQYPAQEPAKIQKGRRV